MIAASSTMDIYATGLSYARTRQPSNLVLDRPVEARIRGFHSSRSCRYGNIVTHKHCPASSDLVSDTAYRQRYLLHRFVNCATRSRALWGVGLDHECAVL